MAHVDFTFETSHSDISMYLNVVPSNIPLFLLLQKESILLTSISLKSIGFLAVPSPNLSCLSTMICLNSSNDFGDILASL